MGRKIKMREQYDTSIWGRATYRTFDYVRTEVADLAQQVATA